MVFWLTTAASCCVLLIPAFQAQFRCTCSSDLLVQLIYSNKIRSIYDPLLRYFNKSEFSHRGRISVDVNINSNATCLLRIDPSCMGIMVSTGSTVKIMRFKLNVILYDHHYYA